MLPMVCHGKSMKAKTQDEAWTDISAVRGWHGACSYGPTTGRMLADGCFLTVCASCVQYSRGQEAAGGPSGRARHEAGGPGSITIGGSGNVRSRFALRSQEVGHPPLCTAPLAHHADPLGCNSSMCDHMLGQGAGAAFILCMPRVLT